MDALDLSSEVESLRGYAEPGKVSFCIIGGNKLKSYSAVKLWFGD